MSNVEVGSEVRATQAAEDHVYAYGVPWSFSEVADWRVALRDFPTDCD